jgi:hypothetical protein
MKILHIMDHIGYRLWQDAGHMIGIHQWSFFLLCHNFELDKMENKIDFKNTETVK